MTPKTLAIIELNMLLARANRLELAEAPYYQRALERLLDDRKDLLMIRTDLNHYDFHTINVHLDTNTNEWRADWHTMDKLIQITGKDTFPNIPWIIKDVASQAETAGYALACFQCPCSSCEPISAQPVQRFIERLYTLRNNANIPQSRETYQAMIGVAEKHQVTYGENEVAELIHYLDQLAPQLTKHPSRLVKQQASDLQRRTENRMSREATEQANREAEQQALREQYGQAAD